MLVALILEERDEREEEAPGFRTGAEGRDRVGGAAVSTMFGGVAYVPGDTAALIEHLRAGQVERGF